MQCDTHLVDNFTYYGWTTLLENELNQMEPYVDHLTWLDSLLFSGFGLYPWTKSSPTMIESNPIQVV